MSTQPVGDSEQHRGRRLSFKGATKKTRKATKEGGNKGAFLALLEPNTSESDRGFKKPIRSGYRAVKGRG